MNVVRISDGLGNQMFQYAFARKLSLLSKQKVYLDIRFINHEDLIGLKKISGFNRKLSHREYGLYNFKIKLNIANDSILFPWNYLQQSNCLQRIIYNISLHDKWIWKYIDEDRKHLEKLSKSYMILPSYYQGYFFDLSYFDDIRGILQHEFALKRKIKLPPNIFNAINNKNTVSIHIRRGDFLKVNRDISDSQYYKKAIQIIEEKVENPIYLICSDEIEWVKKNIVIPGEKIYVSEMGFEDYEELTIMKHCKHNIIANSTFSYWAAYLNKSVNKIVICPKYWKSNIIPESWIKV